MPDANFSIVSRYASTSLLPAAVQVISGIASKPALRSPSQEGSVLVKQRNVLPECVWTSPTGLNQREFSMCLQISVQASETIGTQRH